MLLHLLIKNLLFHIDTLHKGIFYQFQAKGLSD